MNVHPEVYPVPPDRPLRTRDFALLEAGDSLEQRSTIRVRVSPFVYSAWGFGVLMPKPKPAFEDEDVWTEF